MNLTEKIKPLLRSKFAPFIATGAILLLIGIIFRLITPGGPLVSYRDITPGKTTKQELIERLGEATVSALPEGSGLSFRSDYVQDPHIAVTDDQDKTKLFIQKTDYAAPQSFDQYRQELGAPEATFYTDYLGPYYAIYAYPGEGLAFGVHISTNQIVEIWYFEKTTLQGFLDLAPYPLSTTPPEHD